MEHILGKNLVMSFTINEKNLDIKIPILLIGYCRPIEFERIINLIESLPQRDVHISLDGPKEGAHFLTTEVLSIAQKWQQESKHSVTVSRSETNLGLLSHFVHALESFFARYNHGLILEDDMEFRAEFVEFLDSMEGEVALEKYWSVCGHNPSKESDLFFYNRKKDIHFFETSVHTIWGWATSKSSVNFFLDFVNRSAKDSMILYEGVYGYAGCMTKDRVFGSAIIKNWSGKIDRALNSQKPNWDNYWVLAGWSSKKYSLMPNYSLSRENPQIFGIQTHQHVPKGKSWDNISDLLISRKVLKQRNHRDGKLVAVWGNTRMRAYKSFVRKRLCWGGHK